MPRKRKTMSGADAQNIKSVPGQRYGEGDDQAAMQRAMPAPDTAGTVGPAGGAPPMPAGPPVAPPPSVDPAQVQQFLQSNNPAMLSGSQRPNEVVTNGLSIGPGAGTEAIGSVVPAARWLNQLANDTGNDKWRKLAERAGIQ